MDEVGRSPGVADADELAPWAEAEWGRLRNQLELAQGFWLGFVFAPSPSAVRTLQRRTEQLLRLSVRPTMSFEPESPSELARILPKLFDDGTKDTGCVWVIAIHADKPDTPEEQWTAAWEHLLLRMNERRDALRRHLGGGLVLAARPSVKPLAREGAPDLWSVRSLVIELRSVPGLLALLGARGSVDGTDRDLVASPRSGVRLSGAAGSSVSSMLDLVDTLLSAGRVGDALAAAREALEFVEPEGTAGEDLASVLTWLSRAEEAAGDHPAAIEHAERALAVRTLDGDALSRELLDRIGRLAWTLGELDRSIEAYERFVEAVRPGGSEGDARASAELSQALDGLGFLRLRAGDLTGAAAAIEEALAVDRRRVESRPTDPDALRDLATSLQWLGDVRLKAGDLAATTQAFEESVELERRIPETYGPTPEDLRSLSVALNRMGDIRMLTGDVSAAIAAYEESAALAGRVIEDYGPAPESIRDMAVSLEKLGDGHMMADEPVAAIASYEGSLALHRRHVDQFGRTGQPRDLAVVVARLGGARLATGDVDGALAAYGEAIDLARLVLATYGPGPEALADLVHMLERLGMARASAGDSEGAEAAFREALALARSWHDAYPDDLDAVKALSVALTNQGDVSREAGDTEAAGASYEEALRLTRRITAPRPLDERGREQLLFDLERAAGTRRKLGRNEDAAAAEAEIEQLRGER